MYHKHLLMDAISQVDDVYLDKYFTIKQINNERRTRRNKADKIYWKLSSVAACVVLLLTGIIFVLVHQEDDTNYTSYQTYEEVAQIIGYETLLKNVDFSNIDNYSLKVFHKTGSVDQYEKLEFISNTTICSYKLDVDFCANDDVNGYYKGGVITRIKGIDVEIFKKETAPDSLQYIARFEYNDCQYTLKTLNNISEDAFYALLYDLLE